jgi:hypothetical protein
MTWNDQGVQAQAQAQAYMDSPPPPRQRPLTEMTTVSMKQAQDIRDLTAQLHDQADSIFGQEPSDINQANQAGVGTTSVAPTTAMLPLAEQAQFSLGEAIEALRRAVQRVCRL